MKENKSFIIFRQHIIPAEEIIRLIEGLKAGAPERAVCLCGNRQHLASENATALENILSPQRIFLYDDVNELSKIRCLSELKKQGFDVAIIPVLSSVYSFPENYTRSLLTAMFIASKLYTYDIEKRKLCRFRRSNFYKLLWYDFFIVCMFLFFFPATIILLGTLFYSRFRISWMKTSLYRS